MAKHFLSKPFVKALTGVDTDRLPEEKKRNLTIDLGFAYLPTANSAPIGFIDIPGHQRFIRNALCGLAGTDFVLFVIAADDGTMPQTEEHLAIINFLGITSGAVAITKTDRVSKDRLATAIREIEALFAGTSLADAPLFPVSALTGDGIPALRTHLTNAASSTPPRSTNGRFRLAIDRRFDVVGAGLIITGTVFAGSVSSGDTLKVLGADMPVRVRGLHAQNTKANSAHAGQRCALNLTGPELRKDLVHRGDWITTEHAAAPVCKFDCLLTVLDSEPRALAHWTPAHVHLGSAETPARIVTLEAKSIEPGRQALAQIITEHPIGALYGDRFIVRDQSSRRTIGGGQVLDIFPPTRGRAKPERIEWLSAQRHTDPTEALTALLQLSNRGLNLTRFAASRNLTEEQQTNIEQPLDLRIIDTADGRLGFSRDNWAALTNNVTAQLAKWHLRSPSTTGLGENQVLNGTGIRLPQVTAALIAGELIRDGALVKEGQGVRLPSHTAKLQGADTALWKKVSAALAATAPRPMTPRELAEETATNLRVLEAFLLRAGRHGLITRISKNRFSTPSSIQTLAGIAVQLVNDTTDARFSVREFRDASGIGRNLVIEILEFFDQQRFTHRHGDKREVLKPAEELFGIQAP